MKSRLFVLLLVPLWLWPALVVADEARWEQYMRAAAAAYQRGDYEMVVLETRRALEEAEALGEQDARLAITLNSLALLYQSQGRYDEAEPLSQRLLGIVEKALGSEHPDFATHLSNLAELYRVRGRYAEAEPLYQRALAIREKGFGSEHPDVTATLNNLAGFYRAQGRNEDAERLLREHGQ